MDLMNSDQERLKNTAREKFEILARVLKKAGEDMFDVDAEARVAWLYSQHEAFTGHVFDPETLARIVVYVKGLNEVLENYTDALRPPRGQKVMRQEADMYEQVLPLRERAAEALGAVLDLVDNFWTSSEMSEDDAIEKLPVDIC